MSLKNISYISKFNLFIKRKQIITWSISIVFITFIYMILFPYVQDLARMEMEAMPDDLLMLFGLNKTDDIGIFSSYFTSIYIMLLVGISIFSATFSTNLICSEETTKSIEFLDSHNISRCEIYTSKVIVAYVSISILLLLSFITTVICGFINGGESFSLETLFCSWFFISFSSIFFSSISFLLAGYNPKYATGGIVSSIVFLSYLLGYLGQLLNDKIFFLKYLSPFITLSISQSSDINLNFLFTFCIYVIISFIFINIGKKFYNKRDYNI
ncbi:MAG: ABC transporter permease subunit [bacterium]